MMRFVLALTLAVTHSAPALAQSACADAIETLADIVIDGRADVPRLAARRYGTQAAFLKIRYGELPAGETEALLTTLQDAGAIESDQLAATWTIHQHGYAAAKRKFDAKTLGLAMSSTGISVMRAMLLSDDGAELVVTEMAALPKERQPLAAKSAMMAAIDLPDDKKARIVEVAERHELWFLAATFAAIQSDVTAWKSFAERQEKRGGLDDLSTAISWAPAFVGNPALPRGAYDKPEYAEQRKMVHDVMITAALGPERDFLMTFLNQTGMIEPTAAVSKQLREDILSGKLNRKGTFDDVWLSAYRALLKATAQPDMVATTFESIPFSLGRYLRTSEGFSVRDVVDRLMAVETLTPYVQAKADDPPPVPVELSAKMAGEWANWSSAAQMIRGDAPSPEPTADPAMLGISAELLFGKGDEKKLTEFIASAPAGEPRVALANDFAARLDRKCASYLWHPSEAVLLAGQQIYKFDTPK
ncbi:hypothetical protein [Pararhizobium arenae]|uniref:hypothetical protein n=1 Tax=Pararhizobium arenae TaxID=1856850 RepID=UPI00094B5ABD|nr:hypothetical protein [Pararhizobium arenae]